MKSLLRAAAVMSSLVLLFGCVWFTQKQANLTMMPSSKLLVLPAPDQGKSPTVMSGSKSGTLIMSGSKSFTGATTVSGGVLQVQTDKQQAVKP